MFSFVSPAAIRSGAKVLLFQCCLGLNFLEVSDELFRDSVLTAKTSLSIE